MQKIGKIIFCFCFLFISDKVFAAGSNYVRVAVMQNASSLNLKVSGTYEILDSGSANIISKSKDLNTTVTCNASSFFIGPSVFKRESVILRPQTAEAIIINGRVFRGNIQFLKAQGNKFTVINHLGLEDYVKGILYHEASHYWPIEALKVQAIASRTYAFYQMQERKDKDFDLTGDIYSQVYGGKTSERYRTNKAVDETKGEVITYRGKVIPAYFHATCAGHTEDASVLWNIDLPPLKGVVCSFCKGSPHYNWQAVVPSAEIKEKLAAAGIKLKGINGINVSGRDASGRITYLTIISAKKEVKIPGKNFREAISPNIIRSTNFTVTLINGDAVFEGSGWGHGVGLCQWGAYFMAKEGKKASEILKYYYPGSEISSIASHSPVP